MGLTKVTASGRHMKRSMNRAIRESPIRALAELILNADDSYRRLEDAGANVPGSIEIELRRRHANSTVVVRDHAEGMSPKDAVAKMADWGGAQSGQEKGGSARGFYGRGAKDALMMMEHGKLFTIRDSKLTTLTFIRDGRGGEPDIEDEVVQATALERKRVGVPKGNGTVVSFDIASGTPQFNRLKDSLTNYYMLRRLNSDPSRTVTIRNETTEEETQLTYNPPVGEQVAAETRKIKIGAFEFELDATVFLASEDLDQSASDRREGGILVLDEYDSALDLSLYAFDQDPDAGKIFGEVAIRGLRAALLVNENIVTEERDGLNRNDPIAQRLITEIESILAPIVKSERAKNAKASRKLSSSAQKRVNNMLDELNKLAAEYTNVGISPGEKKKPVSGGDVQTDEPTVPHPDIMMFVPASVTLSPGIPETVTLYVNTKTCTGEAIVESDNDDLEFSPESFNIDAGVEIFHQTIHLRCDVAGGSGILTIITDNGEEATLPYRVEEASYPLPAEGLEFVPGTKDVIAGKGRTLDLYVDISKVPPHSNILLELEDATDADLERTSARVDPSAARASVVHIPVKVIGRRVGAKTRVIATASSYSAVCQIEVRSRKAKERSAGGLFAGVAFDERSFPKISFRPEDEYLVIHTNEPSFQLIGVSEASFGVDRGVQVAVAEACTQLACSRIAERTVPGGNKRNFYLSTDPTKRMQEDRLFTEQLTRIVGPIVYRNLVKASATSASDAAANAA